MQETSVRRVFTQYRKQLVASRTLAFHQQTLHMLSRDEERADPEAKRDMVIKRVARELWMNFSVRGEDTPMFRHLCAQLRTEYGADFEFCYQPGSIDLMILQRTESGLVSVNSQQRLDMINRAWKIALEVVASYVV